MSFGLSTAALSAIVSAVGVGISAYTVDQSRHAANQAKDASAANADQQEQQFNKLNGKNPDSVAMADQNTQAGKNGPSGTLLTGPTGVDPTKLTLGKNTLLGGTMTPTATGTLGG